MPTPFFDAINTLFSVNLVRHVKCNEASGTTLDDATDHRDMTANNGALVGQDALSPDDGDKSIQLDGVDDYAGSGGGGLFSIPPYNNDCTWGVLFRTSNSSQNACLISAGRTNTTFGHFMIWIEGGQIRVGSNNTDGTSWSFQFDGPTGLADGQTHLLVFTSDGAGSNEATLFIDDLTPVVGTCSPILTDNSAAAQRLGVYTRSMAISPPDSFEGNLAHFFVATQVVDSGDVGTLFAALTPTPTGVVRQMLQLHG